jgi:hypothetical protein
MLLSFVFIFGFFLVRTKPTVATAATFATFYGSEGQIGQAFLTDAVVNSSVKSVHHLVVSTGIPMTAPKMRKQFGNAVTQATAKVIKDTPISQPPANLLITLQQQFQAENITSPLEDFILMFQL